MGNLLEYDTFAKHLNTKFIISIGESDTIDTELVEVGERQLTSHQDRFAIIFQAPSTPALNQGTYSFSHEGMGNFDLFIVPIGYDSNSIRYEAVFNRLIKPTS